MLLINPPLNTKKYFIKQRSLNLHTTCFDSALQIVADKEQVDLQSEVTANVSMFEDGDGYKLTVGLQVKGNNVDKSKLDELVQKANQIWPYSEAKRANMDITIEVQ